MSPLTSSAQDLNWLITNFVERVPHRGPAIVVSADGLPLAFSAGFPGYRADQLAAVASGLATSPKGLRGFRSRLRHPDGRSSRRSSR